MPERFLFPENIKRVTAGTGGEALLIFGEEKTVLYDCGMAYCHRQLIKNIDREIKARGRKQPDIILMSHTHYDHVGALPYILKKWPDVIVIGAEKAKKVFESEGALKTMKRLGEVARDTFSDSKEPVETAGFRIDRAVKEGDLIDLGKGQHFVVLKTKGHTDCSLTYVLEPDNILFASESTGVYHGNRDLHTAILKSYRDTIDSAVNVKPTAQKVINPHFGILPEDVTGEYFDLYVKYAEIERDFILKHFDEGESFDEIMQAFEEAFFTPLRRQGQPRDAFLENAQYTIRHIVGVFRNNDEK